MAGYAAAAVLAVKAIQVLLASLQNNLEFGAYLCPLSEDVDTVLANGPFDHIIVGAGSAGSVLAYRLAETNSKVLVIEEGACPPIESIFPGLFTMLPYSDVDRQMNIYNDSFSCQNIKPGMITAGKMLGGSSGLGHMMYISPIASDYDSWGKSVNDLSWSFPDFAKYFAKGENVQDPGVFKQNSIPHGTNGPQTITKKESSSMKPIIDALVQMGSKYVSDAIGPCNVNYPLLGVEKCKRHRQSGVGAYLSKIINSKVTFITGATVTKINFNNTKATGVQFKVADVSYSIDANKNVIISAGAIKTPQLLTVSGIGDAAVLKKLDIPIVIDNKHVGKHLKDHVGMIVAYGMEKSGKISAAVDPSMFPVDMVTNYAGPSCNGSISDQEMIVRFPPNSTGLLQLCTISFKYLDEICDAIYESNIDRYLMATIINLAKPASEGYVEPKTSDIKDDPLIVLNLLNNAKDVEVLAERALAFNKILNTTVFKNMGVELADVGICPGIDKNTLEFWKCYSIQMSSTMWHYSGTCAMGKVVDSKLSVIGTENLKVVDASVLPEIPIANILSTVRAVAEKAADIIKLEDKTEIKHKFRV